MYQFTNSFSLEERDLLDDPEVSAFRLQLAATRNRAAEDEREERSRQDKADGEMLQLLQAHSAKKENWNSWAARWNAFTDAEAVFLSKMKTLCERLLWLEDDEEQSRDSIVCEYFVEFDKLRQKWKFELERLEYGRSWKEQFDKEYASRWNSERERAEIKKLAIMSKRDQQEIDEEVIALLRSKMRSVLQKDDTICS